MAISAYAALLSLADVLNNVQHPARHLDGDRIQSLQEKATPSSFCEDIDKEISKIDSITKELMMIKEEWSSEIPEQKPIPSRPAGSSTGLPSTPKDSTMVGFDEDQRYLPIVGMGGIGKTTLAQNAFNHPSIVNTLRIWFTISQIYNVQEILQGLLNDGKIQENSETLAKLGERFHKKLFGRRYLIVMDDVWNIKAWNELSLFFPDNGNRSRIMMTTRMSEVAVSLGCHDPYLMSFLNEEESWNLFCDKVFGQKRCSYPELEEIGKDITKACRGLPLAIVAIAGLLANSNMQQQYWESIAENVNSFANSQDNDHCLKVLSLSYSYLPLHLKACFLYMSVLPEDYQIKVSELVQIWIGEGFIESERGKILEETANGYLEDLVARNLILIGERAVCGKIRSCSIRDLLRDLCLREFDKEHFVRNLKVRWHYSWKRWWNHHWGYLSGKTCFMCCKYENQGVNIDLPIVFVGTQSTSVASIWICDSCKIKYPNFAKLRLARVMDDFAGDEILELTKLRCLFLDGYSFDAFQSSSLHLLWNLNSLLVDFSDSPNNPSVIPNEIWEMPQLRHLKFQCALLPNPTTTQGSTILENLHTLSGMLNFRCTKEAVERIPNLKKLKIKYSSVHSEKCSGYCLENLAYLHKLESLSLSILTLHGEKVSTYGMLGLGAGGHMHIAFPNSLKKLSLKGGRIPWENATLIGLLPNLEVLKLLHHSFDGPEWNPEEGQFSRLKALYICESNLVWWRAESTHFPSLERLFLKYMYDLKEVPYEIGDIATLGSIYVERCSKSATISAELIEAEQHSNGNELEVHVHWSKLPSWTLPLNAVLFLVRLTRALNREDLYRGSESEYLSSPVESDYLSFLV
ncbi:putative late blight resistance proteinR1A-10 [Sesamum angolense]|uniref:Late blight resistance proteinR1A-10 n=1 Tax=Sesamum angolense TaxID=2727404 RepID=A0AAE1WJY4_9LAMI|nr:putative late blight resistance proteinR1A-10 [Sesamum angolense]